MACARFAVSAALALVGRALAESPPVALRGSLAAPGGAVGEVEPEARRLANASEVPAWCSYVPTDFQNVACGSHTTRGSAGSGSCGCAGWCENTFGVSWQWDPECCGCDESKKGSEKRGERDNAPHWCDDIPREERSEVRACQAGRHNRTDENVPDWCEYVPVGVKANVLPCSGSDECSCARECHHTPEESWLYSPECCGCDGAGKHADKHRGTKKGQDGKNDTVVPKWCKNIPEVGAEWVPQCTGEQECACGSTCTLINSDFWRWNPDCCGCTGGEADTDDENDDPHRSQAPEWCTDVPVSERINMLPCSGLGECSCSSVCDAAPQAFWRYNPLCCGCDGAKEKRHHAADKHEKTAEPSWCDSIPEGDRDYAPQCSTGECQCAEECDSASPLQWRFVPGCCGCQTNAKQVDRRDSRDTPSWCNDVLDDQLPFMPQCTGNACSCSSLCHWTPKISWDNNPACCGCGDSEDNKSGDPTPWR